MKNILEDINNEFYGKDNDIKIIKILKDNLEDIIETLTNKKKEIIQSNEKDNNKNIAENTINFLFNNFDWIYSPRWKKIKKDYEDCFQTKTKLLKDNLINYIKIYLKNIKNHYDQANSIFKKMNNKINNINMSFCALTLDSNIEDLIIIFRIQQIIIIIRIQKVLFKKLQMI